MSLCFCEQCCGKACHRTTVQRHFERQGLLNSSLEDASLNESDASSSEEWRENGDETEYAWEGDSLSDASVDDTHMPNCSSDSDEHSNTGEEVESDEPAGEELDITAFILRHLKSKIEHGLSQEATMEGLRNLYELLGDERIPHKSWKSVIQFLKGLGYRDARLYKICFGKDHVTLMEGECCVDCGREWQEGVDYYVLGFCFEDIFIDIEFLKRYLAHWRDKEEWLNVADDDTKRKEIWHGSRFKELSYFWDNNQETQLPAICPNCGNIFPVDFVEEHDPGSGDTFPVTCNGCFEEVIISTNMMRGCPLNQAFIVHEDGFNAFSKKTRSVATIQIASACMTKEDRSHGSSVQVYSFVPTCFIEEGIVHKMDAFFKPLINDVKKYYVEGIPVTISENIQVGPNVIQVGTYTVRLLVICGSADIKSHGEISLYSSGGKLGCRRCLVCGEYIPEKRHYYYGKFRKRFRHPEEARTVEYCIEKGKQCDEAPNKTQRKKIQTETGVCGVSCLCELYYLYGFDPVRDMTVDRMHLVFNMLKREFMDKFWPDMDENITVDVNQRDPTVGGLLMHGDFSEALKHVEWTSEQRASGVAKMRHLTDKLGGWKHAEFLKYSCVAREVLAEKVPSKAYDVHILLCKMVGLLYNKSVRAVGWSDDDIKALNTLAWSHAIASEEYYGLEICTENLEYSTHLSEDVKRHSSPDNYSCEGFERAIRVHKQQTHNAKGVEKTFVERENVRLFLRRYELRNGKLSNYSRGNEHHSVDLDNVNSATFFHESSFETAKTLLLDCTDSTNPHLIHAATNGVLLGKLKRKALKDHQETDIKRQLQLLHPDEDILVPRITKFSKHVVKVNCNGTIMKFSAGDHCILAGGPTLSEEWYFEISDIILIGAIADKYYTFVDGTYYIPAFNHGRVVKHPWTESIQIVPRQYTRESVQFVNQLMRKCILFPEPTNMDNPAFYLPIDFDGPPPGAVDVPVYPEEGDNVKVYGRGGQVWFAKIISSDEESRKANLKWYTETQRAGIYTLSFQEDLVPWRSLLGYVNMKRVLGGYKPQENC